MQGLSSRQVQSNILVDTRPLPNVGGGGLLSSQANALGTCISLKMSEIHAN